MKRLLGPLAASVALLAFAALLAPVASADSAGRHPASLLIYPIFDSAPGAGTVISVTNVSHDLTIEAHFIYIEVTESGCKEFNRFETLTPRDNFTVRASHHVPGARRGFLYVVAEQPRNTQIAGNELIGDEIVVDSYGNFLYAFEAIPFCAKGPLTNDDDVLDFNGQEYFRVANRMFVSSFLGNTSKDDSLPLISTLILVSLVGSPDYETRLDLTPYNNNEQEFSTEVRFRCWIAVCLADIDELFLDEELKKTNWDTRQNGLYQTSGWIEIDGDEAVDVVGNEPKIEDPPFVGAIVQALGYFASGHLLHESPEDNPTDGKLDV